MAFASKPLTKTIHLLCFSPKKAISTGLRSVSGFLRLWWHGGMCISSRRWNTLSIWRHNRAHDLSSGPHTLNESVEKHLFIHPSPPSQVSLKRLTGVFSASFSLLSSGQSRSCFNIDAIHGKRKTDCDFDEICAFF